MADPNKEVSKRKNEELAPLQGWPDRDRWFDQMAERFLGHRLGSIFENWPDFGRRNTANIQEDDKRYIVTAEIPGIPRETIDINLNGNLLTIRAEHREERGEEKSREGYRRHFRSFQQSFVLPNNVNADQIEASCDNGMLEVILPKSEQAKAKKIEVQPGKGKRTEARH